MEFRITTLEDSFIRMESKLDAIGMDMAYIKGKLEGMPNSLAFGDLKGRVESLPTTARAGALLGMAVAFLTILLKWDELAAFFRS